MPRPLALLMLLSTTVIWGFAFVSQKSAMAGMGPLSFAAARYLLGALVLVPVVMWELRRRRASAMVPVTRRQWWLVAVICVVFFFGSILQQVGLRTTTVTNAGFLTGLYVFFGPVFGWLLFRTRVHRVIIASVPLALLGIFLLSGGRLDALGGGDLLVVLCAVFWGVHVVLLGWVSRDTGLPVLISWLCFASAGLLALVLAPVFEAPSVEALLSGWPQIVYAGVLSTAVAFTFQAVAQQYVPPANAAVILSSESMFAALGGAVLLGERLPAAGYLGAALILVAIVLVEAVPAMMVRRKTPAPG